MIKQKTERSFNWPTLQLLAAREQIDQPSQWRINSSYHSIIVHLGGWMTKLETELEGHCGSIGPANPGEVWTVPAGRRYSGQAVGTSIQYAVLLVEPKAFGELCGSSCGAVDLLPFAGRQDGKLFRLTSRLVSCSLDQTDALFLEAEVLSHEITNHLYNQYQSESPLQKNATNPRFSKAQSKAIRDFIFDSLSKQITLEHLAEVSGMTVHHLLIAFRKMFGSTPAQYLIWQRLRRAQWLLLNSKMEITEIAIKTGFSSHSHLTSVFSHRIGHAPSEYRSNISANGKAPCQLISRMTE